MTVSGIDVASYQSTDYSTTGLAFVMVKATEGTGYVNPRRAGQVATGRTRGLVVGHYHFARPGSLTAQATYFLQHAAPRPGEVLCLDWEDGGVSDEWKDAWIRHVQAAAPGHRVVLYCNRDFWLNRDRTGFAGDGLWIADPGVAAGHPRVGHPWVMHQYSEAGGLDRNVANFASTAALRAWAAGTITEHQEDDDMPTAQEIAAAVWAHTETAQPGTKPVRMGAALGWMDIVHSKQNKLLAQAVADAGALRGVIAAMQENGGLTVEQAEAAGKAGAQAALAELGDALTKEN